MGCDIHIYAEYKKKTKWHSADHWEKSRWGDGECVPSRFQVYDSRNYKFFAWLANVRNGTWGEVIPVLSEPRDLPNDMSPRVREEFKDGCYHSCSHYTLKELQDGYAIHKDASITFDAVVHRNEPGVKDWLKKPVSERGHPPGGYCAGSNSPDAVNAQWTQKLSELIGPAYGQVYRWLWNASFDFGVENTEVRIVFGFDS